MTEKPAAIRATFSDFRIVKGRKVCQFLFETPLEAADDALRVLGGLPQPMAERWVGIALLDPKATQQAPQAPDKPKRKMAELPIAQRAALLCNREAFWLFLQDHNDAYWNAATVGDVIVKNDETAAHVLRSMCGVASRSEFATNVLAATKFEKLERDFADWLADPI